MMIGSEVKASSEGYFVNSGMDFILNCKGFQSIVLIEQQKKEISLI